MKKLPKNFCWRPFTQLYLQESWHKPCCEFTEKLDNSNEFNKEVRDYILRNEWHPGCVTCKTNEENNNKKNSFRLKYNFDKIPELVVKNTFIPKIVELHPDNTCNLACITCGSYDSSKWAIENRKMGISENYRKRSVDLNLVKTLDFWKDTNTCILYGGETFYSKKILDILNFLVSNKISSNLNLFLYTNGTFIDDEIIDLLSQFKHCDLGFSIDSVNERFNIIRWPANYIDVRKNFIKTKKLTNTNLRITYTFSVLNSSNFIEDMNILNEEFTNKIYFNVLNNPPYYMARNLPDELKQIILNSLKNKEKYKEVIDELKQEKVVNFNMIKARLQTLDKFRNTDSSILFPPEVWDLADK